VVAALLRCAYMHNVTGYRRPAAWQSEAAMLWIIVIGFVAGVLARLISPGPNKPGGFILTIVLVVAGAFLSTFIGQAIGWYRPDQGAGFIAATIGALLVLFIWNRLVASGSVRDPSA
jgi:uncharacterized membrane protein YeaQ/YmgE (transglycosylase-associated protein family)